MKKITLLVFALFFSFSAYCQFPNPGVEGFENTTGPDTAGQTSVWTLGTGVPGNQWAVFDDFGSGRWGINNAVTTPPTVCDGTNIAYMNRVNVGQGNTSQHFLATPKVTVPVNGQLRFLSRTFTAGNTGTLYDVKWAPGTANQTDAAAYTITLATYTEDELTLDSYSGVQNAFNICTQKIINFPATIPAGTQGYIVFVRRHTQQLVGIDGDRWLLDDVTLNSRCLDPTNLGQSGLFFDSADLTWGNPSGATSWEIEVLPAAGVATGVGVLYNGSLPYHATATATGTLFAPNTCYKYYVRAVCPGSIPSAWVGPFNFCTTTAPPVCGGNYVDAGGPTGNYPNNSTAANGTTVICPTTPGDQVTVTFTAFNTQLNTDILSIYDGNNSSAPLLGAFSGTAIPPSFTSSAASGCLTFVFISNATTNNTGWIANVTCGPPPVCPKPTALVQATPATATSINLGWTNVGPATSWQYLVLPQGSPAPTAASTGWVATGTNPVLITTGIAPGTCYDLYVRGDCSSSSNGLSLWSNPLTVCTPLLPPQCGGNYVDSGGINGNYNNNVTAATGTTVICPATPGDLVTVTFTQFALENNFDFIRIYDGQSATAPLIGTYTGNNNPGTITATSANGCLTFVFTSDGSVTAAGWLANITCAPPPACQKPTNIVTSAVTSNSVTVAWTSVGVGTAWQVLVQPCTAPAPTAATTGWLPASGSPFVYPTTLSPTTCYNVYVRSDCSSTSNGVSTWAGPVAITTQAAPPVCGGQFVDVGGPAAAYPANSNSTVTICPTVPGEQVTVTFTTFNTEANFDGLYVYNGSTVTPAALMPSANPAGNVPGGLAGSYWGNLTGANLPGPFTSSAPDGCLTFVFRSDGSVQNPGWIANITCGPPPTCAKPINLTAIVNSSTSATLNWTQPANAGGGTATQWQVIVQVANGPVPNAATPLTAGVIVSTTTPAPPYTVTGLTPGTTYEFYVRAICSPTDNSPWGGPRTFFTQTSCGDSLPFCGNTGLSYTNTTGAPSYGNIGCLGTTPNPAWYFMQVQNSGNLTFQIAQTTTGGAGIDVDFICWGPFTPAQYATLCNNLYDYPDGNTTIPNNVVGCSYSAAPIENFTITNAVAGNYYMVLITNFSNQAGTVTFTQTNNGASGAGSTNCAIVCSVALGNDVVLCPQATSYTITATTQGATSYAWYFNGSTTPIPGQTSSTLVVTQAGDYTVVIQCGLNTATDTVNVSFGTAPSATISYAGSPYCRSITTAQNVTFTGTTGGTYSALPAGLFINSTTGAVTPSLSQPGQYTVTYTVVQSGGCPIYTTTATVEIIDALIPTFTQVQPICPGDALAPLPTTSLNGVTGTWAPALDNTTTTTYTFTPTAGLCATTAVMTINVGSTTPTFTQVAPICPGDALLALPTTSNNNITGTWSPALDNTTTTTYTFTPTPGVCATAVTMTIVVNPAPVVTVSSSSICTGGSTTVTATPAVPGNYNYVWTVPPGATDPGNVASFTTSVVGIYSVVISLVGTNTLCNTSFEQPTATGAFPNLINENLVPCWETTAADGIIEIWPTGFEAPPYAGNQLVEMNGNSVANIYQDFVVNPGTTLNISFAHRGRQGSDAVRVEIGPAAGPLVSLGLFTDPNGVWATHAVSYAIPATDSPNYRLQFVSVSAAGGSPSVGNLLDAISVNVLTGCPSLPGSGTVTLLPDTTATFDPIPNICQGLPAPALPAQSTNATPITGTWSPNTIDTTTVGTTVYTFTPNPGQCAAGTTLSVTIVAPSIVPTFTQIGPICQNAPAPSLPIQSTNGTPITGTWSPATIDTSVIGSVTYFFTPDPGQCAVATQMQITIIAPTTATFTQIAPMCQGSTAPALPTTSSNGILGTWSPATISTASAGSTVYTFTPNTGQCASGTTMTIVVHPTPVLAPVSEVDACDSYTLPALSVGNYYAAAGGVSPITNLTLTSSQLVYVYAQSGTTPNCTDQDSFMVNITPSPQFNIEGGCDGAMYVLEVTDANFNTSTADYSWTGPNGPVGTNSPILHATTAGTYTVIVTIDNGTKGGCSTSHAFNANDISCIVPKGISPNGDGLNDSFDLSGYNVGKLSIFNRFGTTVYTKTDYSNEWFGQSKSGNELPDGTYYYVIERKDGGDTLTGWVFINREIK